MDSSRSSVPADTDPNDNLLHITWHDPEWAGALNTANVLDYFSHSSNPFYDRQCNNEVLRMQRRPLDQLNNMTGVECILLHVQEPILYIVRKQHRQSPTQAIPLADYYIIDGHVHQSPDLAAVLSTRLANAVHNLQTAFSEARSYARYSTTKGYHWQFKPDETADKTDEENKEKSDTETKPAVTAFQAQRVDMLLADLVKKFPPKPAPSLSQVKSEAGDDVRSLLSQHTSTSVSAATSSGKPPKKKAKVAR